MTTTLPDKVPGFLATTFAGEHEWNYCRRLLFHNGSFSEFPHLPSLDDLTTNQSVGLLVTTNGQLHLYLDGQHVQEVASGLPAFKPLWGAVSVYGKCTEIKSEILSGECVVWCNACACVCVFIHDKQAKAKIYTQDSFLFLQIKTCPGWDSNPQHSTF